VWNKWTKDWGEGFIVSANSEFSSVQDGNVKSQNVAESISGVEKYDAWFLH
jgi:hypothetical protein